jgi:HEAT repeat protein
VAQSSGQKMQIAEGLVKAMSAASRTLRLYPDTSPLPLQAVRNFHTILTDALADHPLLSIGVSREGFSFQRQTFGEDNEGLRAFAGDLYAHQIAAVIFRTGVNEREILEFLRLLSLDPMLLREQGGMSKMLLEQQVSNLVVDEIELRVVGEEGPDGGATTQMAIHLVDEVSHTAVRAVEHFFLAMSSSVPEMVAWLKSVSPPAVDEKASPAENITAAVRQLGMSISTTTELPQDQALFFRNIAEGILSLDEPLKSDVLCGRLIPDSAEGNIFAKILAQFSDAELADLLAVNADASLGKVAELVEDLGVLGKRQQEIFSLLEPMLQEQGHDRDQTGALKEKLTAVDKESEARSLSDEVLQILMSVSEYSDADLKAIDEVNQSSAPDVTDMSAIRIQLNLLSESDNEEEFVRTLASTGEVLARLVREGHVELAAEALDAASARSRAALKMWPEVGNALRALGQRVGGREEMQALVEFLRVKSGERDVGAVSRYINLLPDSALEHLVDLLAEESSMAVRKRLCAVFSDTGRKAAHVLAKRLSDPRWYLVRNVLSVFGMMRDATVLPYIEATLTNPDPRVRMEAVRTLGLLRAPAGVPWLVARLDDQDGGVRVAAARWLGRMRSSEAVQALGRIAESRGRGDFDVAKAAIQALGQIGDESARPALERVVRRRSVVGRKRAKELKAAAAAALASLTEQREGEPT